MREVYWNCRWN